ncbi:frataxin, mitochondrial [Cynara cardunculus var. scolymus]|uniref:ferroxidase n=1 Tax=Cynara cardunculus var. scolymus TaxID=59895 RepID=A0A103XS88_CYNCS|nr:frataxin, mitochondrial [Cynara cardunculus var. scolymus]KVH95945.1 Frataxin [Cynara cardunculus var. scolymus]
MASSSKFLRRVSTSLNSIHNSRLLSSSSSSNSRIPLQQFKFDRPPCSSSLLYNDKHSRVCSRDFCSRTSNVDEVLSQGPAAVDYSALLQEDEFHKLADATIHDLLEKMEEYGDSVDIDGFDIDYGNQVLTVKFGSFGTYVLNKQTPNRQIWMSSPVSGPSRFDWDQSAEAWIYRRTKAKLLETLETEVQQLCGEPITLSKRAD